MSAASGNEAGGAAESIIFRPIGVIRSPHTKPEETPVQPAYARGIAGRVEVLPAYEEGLRDLEGFSHIYLLYHLHKSKGVRLTVKPFLEDVPHGVFATRAPVRPNAIGMSLVRLVRREGRVLFIEDVDVLDGTPLLDIKPFVTRFETPEDVRNGWQDGVDEPTARERGRRGYRG